MKSLLIFRNADLGRIWLGQVLSQMGTRMYQIAIAWWLVTQGNGSAGRNVGLFFMMGALPALLFVKTIGRMVDRGEPRQILIVSDVAAAAIAAITATLLLLNSFTFIFALSTGFALALCQAFFDPALNKTIAQTVSPKEMEQAVAFQTSTQSLASFAGAMAGAFLIEALGIAAIAAINMTSYLISAWCNWKITPAPGTAACAAGSKDSPLEKIGIWKLLKDNAILKKILLGFGVVNFFVTPILVILPVYVNKTLEGSASILGWLEAGLWIGLLAGTFLSSRLNSSNVIRLGGFCLLLLGACLMLPGIFIHFRLYFLLLALGGLALGVNNVKFVSLFQQIVPAPRKGQFFALMQAMLSFTFPLAYFFFGTLLDYWPAPTVCLIQGSGVIILALFFFKLSRQYKQGQAAA